MRALPKLTEVNSDLQLKNPQLNLKIDRDKAHLAGHHAPADRNAFSNAYSTQQVTTILAPNNQYQVILELLPQFQANPATLALLYVRSQSGQLVPLDTIARLQRTLGPLADQPLRAVHRGHHLVQRRARRLAR